MAIFKCKACGAPLEIKPGVTVVECDHCEVSNTLPKLENDKKANLIDRANHFRRSNEFDKASALYEEILNEDPTDAEIYWSLVLCRYGVEYVEDPASHKRMPTVNRAQFTAIYDDDNYKQALQYADEEQKVVYEKEARAINEIQKQILTISKSEEPFDVFICYKQSDENGERTRDSVIANDLYYQLTQEGFKVFYAAITLEDKLGTAYEPYIFAALNSAKVMVVVATKPEYVNAVWVKNEWSRYLSLIKSGAKKTLIPAYRDMDPYDLPEEFSHLQAQDMTKLGFMQDLTRGIKKILEADKPKEAAPKTVFMSSSTESAPQNEALLKRAFMFLEDGDWKNANAYCEKVLDTDPENAYAYLGKLMVDLQIKHEEGLSHHSVIYDTNNNFQKALRFANPEMKSALLQYVDSTRDHLNEARLASIYNKALRAMQNAKTLQDYNEASSIFNSIPDYKDSAVLSEQCIIKGKEASYTLGVERMGKAVTEADYFDAANYFITISGYKDSEELYKKCIEGAQEAKVQAKERAAIALAQKLKKDEDARKAKQKQEAKRKLKKILIPLTAIVVITTVVLVYTQMIIPMQQEQQRNEKYNTAISLKEQGNYVHALVLFDELFYSDIQIDGQTKSFDAEVQECKDSLQNLMNQGTDVKKIAEIFSDLKTNTSERAIISELKETYEPLLYEKAKNYSYSEDYVSAVRLFDALGDYKDSEKQALEIKAMREYHVLAQPGDEILFGHNFMSSDHEPILWVVLDRDGNKILVLSKYILTAKEFGKNMQKHWENSNIRSWLNVQFYNSTFTAEEQNLISTSYVPADEHPYDDNAQGEATYDTVFLLSVLEIEKYFPTEEMRAPSDEDFMKKWGYFLRTSGGIDGKNSGKAYIKSNGKLAGKEYSEEGGIRPAMWIDFGN